MANSAFTLRIDTSNDDEEDEESDTELLRNDSEGALDSNADNMSYLDPYRNLSALSCTSSLAYEVVPKFPAPHPYFINGQSMMPTMQNLDGSGGLGLVFSDGRCAMSMPGFGGGGEMMMQSIDTGQGHGPPGSLNSPVYVASPTPCLAMIYPDPSMSNCAMPNIQCGSDGMCSAAVSQMSLMGYPSISYQPHVIMSPAPTPTPPPSYAPSSGTPTNCQTDGASSGGGGGGTVVYPVVYVSPAGLLTVLMRENIAVEMTLDRAIRVVNHQHKAVAATNSRGDSSCIYHQAGKIYQDRTTTELDLYGERRAKMATDGIVFSSSNSAFTLTSQQSLRAEPNPRWADLSQDMSVTLLFSSSSYGPHLTAQYEEVAQSSRYKNYRNGATTVFINGARIHQTPKGDVIVWSGRKYLRASPKTGLARVVTHFVEMTVGQSWIVRVRRGGHKLLATGSVFILANDDVEFGFNELRNLFLQPVASKQETIIYRGRSLAQPSPLSWGDDEGRDNDHSCGEPNYGSTSGKWNPIPVHRRPGVLDASVASAGFGNRHKFPPRPTLTTASELSLLHRASYVDSELSLAQPSMAASQSSLIHGVSLVGSESSLVQLPQHLQPRGGGTSCESLVQPRAGGSSCESLVAQNPSDADYHRALLQRMDGLDIRYDHPANARQIKSQNSLQQKTSPSGIDLDSVSSERLAIQPRGQRLPGAAEQGDSPGGDQRYMQHPSQPFLSEKSIHGTNSNDVLKSSIHHFSELTEKQNLIGRGEQPIRSSEVGTATRESSESCVEFAEHRKPSTARRTASDIARKTNDRS